MNVASEYSEVFQQAQILALEAVRPDSHQASLLESFKNTCKIKIPGAHFCIKVVSLYKDAYILCRKQYISEETVTVLFQLPWKKGVGMHGCFRSLWKRLHTESGSIMELSLQMKWSDLILGTGFLSSLRLGGFLPPLTGLNPCETYLLAFSQRPVDGALCIRQLLLQEGRNQSRDHNISPLSAWEPTALKQLHTVLMEFICLCVWLCGEIEILQEESQA